MPENMLRHILRDRSFVIVAVVLLFASLTIKATTAYMKVHFRKERVELRRSLKEFDAEKVRPYKLKAHDRVSPDVEEALGTSEYLQMRFEDPAIEGEGLGRYLSFFVTYYTGDPDQVPHVPEVCYIGGGFEPAGSRNTVVTVPGLGLPDDQLVVKELFFKNSRSLMPVYQTVVYFFSVNGHYVEERTKVRWYLADIWTRYAYFSKVELSFITSEKPDPDQVLALAEKFFRKAIPVLVQDHWANWDELVKK